jgi:hypothetical protein
MEGTVECRSGSLERAGRKKESKRAGKGTIGESRNL